MYIELYKTVMENTELSKDEAKELLIKITRMYDIELEDLGFNKVSLSFYITAFVPIDETGVQADVYKLRISKSGKILSIEL